MSIAKKYRRIIAGAIPKQGPAVEWHHTAAVRIMSALDRAGYWIYNQEDVAVTSEMVGLVRAYDENGGGCPECMAGYPELHAADCPVGRLLGKERRAGEAS